VDIGHFFSTFFNTVILTVTALLPIANPFRIINLTPKKRRRPGKKRISPLFL
jgi:hypothetical protein